MAPPKSLLGREKVVANLILADCKLFKIFRYIVMPSLLSDTKASEKQVLYIDDNVFLKVIKW